MATPASKNPPAQPASNGVITAPPKGVVGGNRKKQKRRAKQAAKAASQPASIPPLAGSQPNELDYDEDPLRYDEEEYDDYSDAEPQHYHDHYIPQHVGSNGYGMPPPAIGKKNKKKKKKAVGPAHHHSYLPALPTPPPPPAGMGALHSHPHPHSHTHTHTHVHSHKPGPVHQNIWNTSTQQERQNIKNFWLSLSEEERKSLLKIEKEAVLRKMKQQQKHSCSCTVCGRKRTAIEEELEVLYEGYYEELEQYAHHDHPLPSGDGMIPDPLQHRRPPHPMAAPPPMAHTRPSRMVEQLDEEEEDEEEEEGDEEDLSEEEEYSDEDEEEYSDEEPEPRGPVPDFFNFGQNLTVKDNLLTVADDLLKNDGRKFIEMMEQLAERRMQRESEAEYASANPAGAASYAHNDQQYSHEDTLTGGEEFDDDEASYDSQEEYDDDLEEEDEMGGLTEEQRMQEGRRMFQIFAARMFEQRVLTAYKEKVAAERQRKLLEELQDEEKLEAQREAKKKRDAEKKKDKKKQQQAAKAEERAKKEAEKAAEEARLREAEEKKLEEQRRKKEEQRRKKEEEKRKQEEDKARKEADKVRRQQEEQQRREESERKVREQRAAEKARKEEARKREREEREAREKDARDRKALEEKEKRDRDAKSKIEARTTTQQQQAVPSQQPHQPQIAKRPSQSGMVAVPGVFPKQATPGIASPHPSIATPAVPKAATPAKQRQASQQGSHASSPKQTQSQISSAPSKSSSPGGPLAQNPAHGLSKTILVKPGSQPQMPQQMQTSSPLHQQPIQPPPGMPHPQHHAGPFGGMPPMGFPGFPGPQSPMMHSMGQRGPVPMHPYPTGPMGMPNRMSSFGAPGMNGLSGPPPNMMHPQGRGMGFPFDTQGVPPGFGHAAHQSPTQTSPIGQSPANAAPGSDVPRQVPSHSRQQSASEKERFESAANQPIARPAPIQRPSSLLPQNDDLDDLSKHLGSSALLDDSDEPIVTGATRRHSNIPIPARTNTLGSMGGFASPGNSFNAPGSSWNTPSLAFGQPGLNQPGWGNLPASNPIGGWAANNNAFSPNVPFGSIVGSGGPSTLGGHRPSIVPGQNRPLNIRLAVCQACRQLSAANRGDADSYHDIDLLLQQIEHNRPLLDSPPSLREIEDICETEGDGQNGGGELHVRKEASTGDLVAVKFEPDAGTPDHHHGGRSSNTGLGEIGSPMPSKSTPSIGFGAPGMPRSSTGAFQSLSGMVGSPSL